MAAPDYSSPRTPPRCGCYSYRRAATGSIRIAARAIWMQEGVENEAAAARAREAGLFVVMDRCIFKDHHARFAA